MWETRKKALALDSSALADAAIWGANQQCNSSFSPFPTPSFLYNSAIQTNKFFFLIWMFSCFSPYWLREYMQSPATAINIRHTPNVCWWGDARSPKTDQSTALHSQLDHTENRNLLEDNWGVISTQAKGQPAETRPCSFNKHTAKAGERRMYGASRKKHQHGSLLKHVLLYVILHCTLKKLVAMFTHGKCSYHNKMPSPHAAGKHNEANKTWHLTREGTTWPQFLVMRGTNMMGHKPMRVSGNILSALT